MLSRRLIALLIPAYLYLLTGVPRTAYADSITITVPADRLQSGPCVVRAVADPGDYARSDAAPAALADLTAYLYDCAEPWDWALIDGPTESLIVREDVPGTDRLSGDTGRYGLGPWAPHTRVYARWCIAGDFRLYLSDTPAGADAAHAAGPCGSTLATLYGYLGAWFGGSPTADYTGDGTLSQQDIFDFLAAYLGA